MSYSWPTRIELVAVMFAAPVALSGCPAPPIEDLVNDFDVVPWDATPLESPYRNPSGAPSCAPEAIVDVNRVGVRTGRDLLVRVDTRGARNDLRTLCVPYDSTEVVLRYTSPPAAEARVPAIRVTTDSPGTTYDTVLGIRLVCTPGARDITCGNDTPLREGGESRRSTIYHVGMNPEDTVFILVDGFDGSAGVAEVTVSEIPELGVLGAPCVPIPPQRATDPTAPTAYFRCPHPGIRCQPGAAPDGTDLCLRVVPIGQPCDPAQRFDVCERASEGVECAQNPSDAMEARCALPGTAPGARCRGVRGDVDRCDAGLVCSEGVERWDRDQCVPLRREGQTCDPAPRGFINRCAPGLECCAEAPDAGATTYCRPSGSTCYRLPPS